jgi:hypothetical protein
MNIDALREVSYGLKEIMHIELKNKIQEKALCEIYERI